MTSIAGLGAATTTVNVKEAVKKDTLYDWENQSLGILFVFIQDFQIQS